MLYLDSSATLAWLLEEAAGESASAAMQSAERISTSALTLLECGRGLIRARQTGRISREREVTLRRVLETSALEWDIVDISETVVTEAGLEFPVEPVRALDAIHLATALQLREAIGDIVILSFDDRLRENSIALGIPVLP